MSNLLTKAKLFTVFLLLTFPASVHAAGEQVTAERYPMVCLAIAILLSGLAAGRALTPWYELSKAFKALRIAAIPVAAFGAYLLVFAATEAPPAGSDGLGWIVSYDSALESSRETGKPMMVDFTADWCKACDELEAEVFNAPNVAARLSEEVILTKIDIDIEGTSGQKAFERFKFQGLPAVAFVDSKGTFLPEPSFEGKIPIDDFLKRLDAVVSSSEFDGTSEFEKVLTENGFLAALLLAFIAGLLASLTPCVYPLIPITIAVFGAQSAKSRREAFLLSVTYVFGIGVTYSILGVVAAIAGTVFGGAMQNPFVLSGIALLFMVLALSSFGVFEIRLPGALQTKLNEAGGAGFAGAFIMGLVAGVIAAPCVGPIVAGILVYVAQQQDIFLGVSMLWTFSMGMGVLFIVLGTFSSLLSRIPTGGGWLDGVKFVIGCVFLGVGLYYLQFLFSPLQNIATSIWRLVG